MRRKEIENKINSILTNYNLSGTPLLPKTKLITDLGLDSITVVELITIIEKEFGIEIQEEDILMKNFSNIKLLIEFINEKIERKCKS